MTQLSGPANVLPGMRQWLARCAAGLAACGVTAAAHWEPTWAPVLAVPLALAAAGPFVRRGRLRQITASSRFRTLATDPAGAQVRAALAAAGVSTVVVRAGRVKGLARSFRAGRHAVILLNEPLLAVADLTDFFIAHEAGHLARHDAVRRPTVDTCALACCWYLSLTWPGVLATLPLLVAAAALRNHAMELSCDRLAMKLTGPGPARNALTRLAAADREIRMTLPRRARRLLTYPAPRRRLAAAQRAGHGRASAS